MKFLSPEVALYLYKSIMRLWTEYCRHIWVGASSCCQDMLDKLQKQICKTAGPALVASLKPLARQRNLASLSPITIPRCYHNVNIKSFFHLKARLWISLPAECFSFTYDLNGFRSRVNRHLFSWGTFLGFYIILFFFLSLHDSQWFFSLTLSESQQKRTSFTAVFFNFNIFRSGTFVFFNT